MFDIHQSVYDQESGELDEAAFSHYVDELLDEFADAPEGKQIIEEFGGLGWAGSLIDYGVDYFGTTPGAMSVGEVAEIVFEIFPKKISVEAERAGQIVAELRAFWLFIQRTHALPNATAILALFGASATQRLQKLLGDPANFGMAKSFVMQGTKLGFDMTTEEGSAAFMLYYNTMLAGRRAAPVSFGPIDSFGSADEFGDGEDTDPVPSTTPRERAEQRRRKRKAERQARKRNRRK